MTAKELIKERLEAIKEKLLDPFNTEGLEEEFVSLLKLIESADWDQRRDIAKDFEEVKGLLVRNLEIILGGLKPLLEGDRGEFFSRRV